MAKPFTTEGKPAVVKGLKATNLESADVKLFGTFAPVEVTGPVKVGGDSVLVGPLGFTISGCTPKLPPNAAPGSCNGGGLIQPAGKASNGMSLPVLRVGDQGQCFGICMTTQVPPVPTPVVCMLKLAESGQVASSAGGIRTRGPPGGKVKGQNVGQVTDSAPSSPQPVLPQLSGALVLVLGPGFRSMDGFEWRNKTGAWKPLERGVIHLGNDEVDQAIEVRWQPHDRVPASPPEPPDLSAWRALVNFVPGAWVTEAIRLRGDGWALLRIAEDGIGPVNLDLYEVVILKRPVGSPFQDPPELLSAIRRILNALIDTTYAEFEPYASEDQEKWAKSRTRDTVGAAVHIDMLGPVNGTVLVSDASVRPAYFRFTTVRSPMDPMHPVSGNREFGVRLDGEHWVVYTRGADRFSNRAPAPELVVKIGAQQRYERLVSLAGEGGFSVADRLWRSFQTRVAEWIRRQGGEADVRPPISNRHDWVETQRRLK